MYVISAQKALFDQIRGFRRKIFRFVPCRRFAIGGKITFAMEPSVPWRAVRLCQMRSFLSLRRSSFFAEVVMKKFLVALLTLIALSGAVLVAHPNSAAAHPPDPCDW